MSRNKNDENTLTDNRYYFCNEKQKHYQVTTEFPRTEATDKLDCQDMPTECTRKCFSDVSNTNPRECFDECIESTPCTLSFPVYADDYITIDSKLKTSSMDKYECATGYVASYDPIADGASLKESLFTVTSYRTNENGRVTLRVLELDIEAISQGEGPLVDPQVDELCSVYSKEIFLGKDNVASAINECLGLN